MTLDDLTNTRKKKSIWNLTNLYVLSSFNYSRTTMGQISKKEFIIFLKIYEVIIFRFLKRHLKIFGWNKNGWLRGSYSKMSEILNKEEGKVEMRAHRQRTTNGCEPLPTWYLMLRRDVSRRRPTVQSTHTLFCADRLIACYPFMLSLARLSLLTCINQVTNSIDSLLY